MIDGQPAYLLSREGCPVLRKGFINGYVFKRLSVTGDERYQDKPNKNKFSHPHDGQQYGLMKFASDRIVENKRPEANKIDMWNPVLRIF